MILKQIFLGDSGFDINSICLMYKGTIRRVFLSGTVCEIRSALAQYNGFHAISSCKRYSLQILGGLGERLLGFVQMLTAYFKLVFVSSDLMLSFSVKRPSWAELSMLLVCSNRWRIFFCIQCSDIWLLISKEVGGGNIPFQVGFPENHKI